MIEHVTRLFQHLVWADERADAALAAGGPAPSDGLPELGHVVAAEEIWLALMEGRAARDVHDADRRHPAARLPARSGPPRTASRGRLRYCGE